MFYPGLNQGQLCQMRGRIHIRLLQMSTGPTWACLVPSRCLICSRFPGLGRGDHHELYGFGDNSFGQLGCVLLCDDDGERSSVALLLATGVRTVLEKAIEPIEPLIVSQFHNEPIIRSEMALQV